MLSFFITIFIMIIFSVHVGYSYLEEDRENILHCDALLKEIHTGNGVVKKLYKSVKEVWKKK